MLKLEWRLPKVFAGLPASEEEIEQTWKERKRQAKSQASQVKERFSHLEEAWNYFLTEHMPWRLKARDPMIPSSGVVERRMLEEVDELCEAMLEQGQGRRSAVLDEMGDVLYCLCMLEVLREEEGQLQEARWIEESLLRADQIAAKKGCEALLGQSWQCRGWRPRAPESGMQDGAMPGSAQQVEAQSCQHMRLTGLQAGWKRVCERLALSLYHREHTERLLAAQHHWAKAQQVLWVHRCTTRNRRSQAMATCLQRLMARAHRGWYKNVLNFWRLHCNEQRSERAAAAETAVEVANDVDEDPARGPEGEEGGWMAAWISIREWKHRVDAEWMECYGISGADMERELERREQRMRRLWSKVAWRSRTAGMRWMVVSRKRTVRVERRWHGMAASKWREDSMSSIRESMEELWSHHRARIKRKKKKEKEKRRKWRRKQEQARREEATRAGDQAGRRYEEAEGFLPHAPRPHRRRLAGGPNAKVCGQTVSRMDHTGGAAQELGERREVCKVGGSRRKIYKPRVQRANARDDAEMAAMCLCVLPALWAISGISTIGMAAGTAAGIHAAYGQVERSEASERRAAARESEEMWRKIKAARAELRESAQRARSSMEEGMVGATSGKSRRAWEKKWLEGGAGSRSSWSSKDFHCAKVNMTLLDHQGHKKLWTSEVIADTGAATELIAEIKLDPKAVSQTRICQTCCLGSTDLLCMVRIQVCPARLPRWRPSKGGNGLARTSLQTDSPAGSQRQRPTAPCERCTTECCSCR